MFFAKMFFHPANSLVFQNFKITFHIFSYRCLAVRWVSIDWFYLRLDNREENQLIFRGFGEFSVRFYW